MTNRKLVDRMVTPDWMSIALRIARTDEPDQDVRELLEIALRDEVDSKTGRKKTATILAGCWLSPTPEASALIDWAKENSSGDARIWHLGVLLANYAFFDELCAVIGRDLDLRSEIDTRTLRKTMKGAWGDREVVDVATRSSIRTLRSFGVLSGTEGESASAIDRPIDVERDHFPWLVHALLLARDVKEMDLDAIMTAPEFFMFNLPSSLPNGYPYLERFNEGGGRVVIGIVERRPTLPPPTRQLTLDVGDPQQLDLSEENAG